MSKLSTKTVRRRRYTRARLRGSGKSFSEAWIKRHGKTARRYWETTCARKRRRSGHGAHSNCRIGAGWCTGHRPRRRSRIEEGSIDQRCKLALIFTEISMLATFTEISRLTPFTEISRLATFRREGTFLLFTRRASSLPLPFGESLPWPFGEVVFPGEL